MDRWNFVFLLQLAKEKKKNVNVLAINLGMQREHVQYTHIPFHVDWRESDATGADKQFVTQSDDGLQ